MPVRDTFWYRYESYIFCTLALIIFALWSL